MMDRPLLPRGFRAAAGCCGLKTTADTLDLALFVSDRPASAAGLFTTNRICGAPVTVSRRRVPGDASRAVIINSGNANACTGEQGLRDAEAMTRAVAERVGCQEDGVLVCSTGIIGQPLPIEQVLEGIRLLSEQLDPGAEAFERAARAMMTTDTRSKQSSRTVTTLSGSALVCGAAKGAAMIAPNMATMLAVIMTDARLSASRADVLLREAVDRSFHRISIDGHTSTSDTVLLLANGAGDLDVDADAENAEAFQEALTGVCEELARAIVGDAEGGTHVITVRARGLASEAEALQIARTVAGSPLVKTAIAGADPNWGRIISAAGYAGVDFAPENLSLAIQGTSVYRQGAPVECDDAALSQRMRADREIVLDLEFAPSGASAEVLTSDLTTEYVRLNAEYTT